MNALQTPRPRDWDNFWNKGKDKDLAKASWSKKRIMAILDPLLAPGAHALDAGCGSGFFANYFCEKEMQAFALDYSDEALQIAKQLTRGRAQIVQADLVGDRLAEKFPQGTSFDVIFSDGLLEHFPRERQQKILRNFYGLLNPRGVLVTFVPNRWSPWELIRPLYMPGIDEKPFVLSELVSLNEECGFRVDRQGGINVLPLAWSPDAAAGGMFGMLLYTVGRKNV